MQKNRKPEVPVDDYTITNAVKIIFHDLKMSIMPRYQEHFVAKNYEQFSIAIADTYLNAGMKAIDVGAHMGAFSIIMANRVAKKALYSYEPVPENRTLLRKNLSSNKFFTENVYPYAISDTDGKATFNIPWASDSAGLYEHPNAETVRKLEVEVRSLDSLHDGEKIDFIKIDTEGNEINVFHGAKKLFAANPKLRMLVEFNPECLEAAGVHDPAIFFEVLHGYGFRTLLVNEDKFCFDEVEIPAEWSGAMNGREYANVYCVPADTKIAAIGFHTAQFGGAEMVALEGIDALEKQGWLVTCILPDEGPVTELLREKARSVHVVPYLPWCRTGSISAQDLHNENRKNAEATSDIFSILNNVRHTVSISHTITQPWLAIASAAKQLTHVWDIHEFGTKGIHYNFDYPESIIFNTISDLSSKVIVHSNAMEKHLEGTGVLHDKIVVCPIGIYEDGKLNSKRKYSKTASNFVMIGKITRHKNQLSAVRAIKNARDRGLGVNLSIVGSSDESYVREIEEFIEHNQLQDFIKLVPHTSNIDHVLQASDMLIMATEYEPFGRVTAEAVISGIPVIGSKVGGTPEIVRDGVDGVLYDAQNDEELLSAIEKVATNAKFYKKLTEGVRTSFAKEQYNMVEFERAFLEILIDACRNSTQMTYFHEKFLPVYRDIKHDDDEKIRMRDEQLQSYVLELEKKHNDLLVANHRIQQLRARLINKSAIKFWFQRLSDRNKSQP